MEGPGVGGELFERPDLLERTPPVVLVVLMGQSTGRSRGRQVVLDLHALPGGSQDGTYNGVWPNRRHPVWLLRLIESRLFRVFF